MSEPPSRKERQEALERAAEFRRALYRADPAYAGHSNLAERVDVVPGPPEPAADDWWRIGAVTDQIAGSEFDVWYRPRRLRVIEREPPPRPDPPDPSTLPRFYQSWHGWIDRQTGEYVSESEATSGEACEDGEGDPV